MTEEMAKIKSVKNMTTPKYENIKAAKTTKNLEMNLEMQATVQCEDYDSKKLFIQSKL